MKKALVGSTALVAAGLLSGGAFAQAAVSPINIEVHGNFRVQAGYVNQDDGPGEPGVNRRNFGFGQDSQIQFRGQTKLDNGITVGVQIELEGESGFSALSSAPGTAGTGEVDIVDEAYMWIENSAVWGRIELGNRDAAGNKMFIRQPFVLASRVVGVPTMQAVATPPAAAAATGIGQLAGTPLLTPASQDSNKITYYTPRFLNNALQLGISYTPDNTENNGRFGVGFAKTDASAGAGQQGDILNLGFNYTTKFGAADVRLAGSYDKGNQESTDADTTDRNQWAIGGQISYMGWTVGGAYMKDDAFFNNSTIPGESDDIHWVVGVTYATGPWLMGVEYYHRKVESLTAAGVRNGDDEVTEWGISVRRSMGGGFTIGGGIRFYDWEDNVNAAANENSATEILLETTLTF
jgi:predicted porin